MKDTPNIRFKGFVGDWEQRKLGEYCEMYNGDRSSKYPNAQDMVSKGIPFINAGDLEDGCVNLTTANKITREKYDDLSGAKLQFGDIVYCLRGTLGKNAYIDNFNEGTVASSLVAIRPRNIDGRYLFHVLNSDIEYRQRIVHDEGAAQPNLSAKNVSGFIIPIPDIDEQKKISSCLDNLNTLITLHQHKHNDIIELKRFMLQKMFPQNCQKVPELRFAGFTGDWELRKLGEIAGRTYGGGTPKTNITEYWDGHIPWIQSSNLMEHELFSSDIQKYITDEGLAKSATQLVPPNSIAVVSHVGVGKLVFMPFKYTTSQDFISLSELKAEPIFTCYSIYKRLQNDIHIVQGSAIKGITKDDLLSKEILLPSEPEQTKIGMYFCKLDHLITLHRRKCNALKEVKKFMLQNMFPQKG